MYERRSLIFATKNCVLDFTSRTHGSFGFYGIIIATLHHCAVVIEVATAHMAAFFIVHFTTATDLPGGIEDNIATI